MILNAFGKFYPLREDPVRSPFATGIRDYQ